MKRLAADQKKAAKLVAADMREGDKAGVEGTPTFYVNGLLVDFQDLDAQVEKALKDAGKKPDRGK